MALSYNSCFQTYLLCDEDIGGRKSEKAKELGCVLIDCISLQ